MCRTRKQSEHDCCRDENVMEEEGKVLKVTKCMVNFAHKEAESAVIS